jgi:hypothetical protein
MESFGVFGDLSLKKSNDLMDVFEEALSKTNNLMETMDNFNKHKIQEKNIINDEPEKNNNNNTKLRKLQKLKTYNHRQFGKFQLKPIKNNNKYFKIREPYNYQKEYENDLINQIETLFNPNYKNSSKDSAGMLSFLTPLINSNVSSNKNKEIYKSKERINNKKSNLNVIKNENINFNNNPSSKSLNKNNYKKKLDEKERRIVREKKLSNKMNEEMTKEIKRPINRAKTNAIKEIYFKSNRNESKSNVDLLINRLKKKYN